MCEKTFYVEKLEGGFIVSNDDADRKIVRKLSEVVAMLKETFIVPVEPVETPTE